MIRLPGRGSWFRGMVCGALIVAAGAPACAPRAIRLEPGGTPGGQPIAAAVDLSDWGLTLSRAVVAEKVDYEKLLADPGPLDRFLASLARTGPTSSPQPLTDENSKLAYAINCYNATILRSVIELGKHGRLPAQVASLEQQFRFLIDGCWRTPGQLRRMAEQLAADDWRVRFALCDGSLEGPPLPPRSFQGDILDAQLSQVTQSALASSQVVAMDHGQEKRLRIWRGLGQIKDRLIREYEQRTGARDASLLNVLLEWSDRGRREALNTAVGYKVAMMEPEDVLNALEPPAPTKSGLLSVFKPLRSFSFLRPHR